MDPLSASFITFGAVLLLASWAYLIIVSFRNDYSWGLTSLFLPPLSYFYSLFQMKIAGAAVAMACIGSVLVLFGLM